MSRQQKIWKGGRTFFYAVRPLLLYLIIPGTLHLLLSFFLPYEPQDLQYQRSTGNFYNCVGTLLTFFLLYKNSKKRGSSIWNDTTLILEQPDRMAAGLCAGLGVAVAVFFSALLTLLPAGFIGSYEADSRQIFYQFDFILAILNLVFVCPIMEELVIRGYLLNRLFGFFSEKQAVLISAAVFACCHVNPLWIVYSFFLGVYMARLALKKDNILYSICFHIGFNLPAAVNACIVHAGLGDTVFFKSKVLVVLYGAVAAASAVLIFRRMTKEETS